VSHYRDHQVFDSIYYVPKYRSSYYAVVELDGGAYTLTPEGTWPDVMRFDINGKGVYTIGIKVVIPYNSAGNRGVWVDGSPGVEQPWDANIGAPAELTASS
jgi:hypothetical protein